jgi:hypothetical protein
MSQPGEIPGAVWFDPCFPANVRIDPKQAGLLIIDAECVDHELRSSTGFLKSRVYAKLLTRLILERYQTFNRQVEEVVPDTA